MPDLELKHIQTPAIMLRLSEPESAPDKIQLLRVGEYHHPTYGKFSITRDTLREMRSNYRANVRGVDLAIDFGHKSEGVAAGWISDIFLLEDDTELWARVKWTPRGEAAVIGKEYRYTSADFGMKAQDPETQKWSGPTLNGAALTNRPFIKRMSPVVQLSDAPDSDEDESEQENEDMKLEEAQAKIKELEKQTKKLSEENTALSDKVKAAEADKKVCDEANMTPEEMMAKIAELTKQLEDMKKKANDATIQASEAKKTAEFNVLLSDGKVVEAQRDAFMKGDTAAFAQLSEKVNLGGGKGSSTQPRERSGAYTRESAGAEVDRLAKIALTEKKAKNYGEAVTFVLSENPELDKVYSGAAA